MSAKILSKPTIDLAVGKGIVEPLVERLELRRKYDIPADPADNGHRVVLLLLHLGGLTQAGGECLGDEHLVVHLPGFRRKVDGRRPQTEESPGLGLEVDAVEAGQ